MGGCATKPKVLKDGDEKPESPPPVPQPPQKVVQREAEKDVAVAPVDSPSKNLSLGNLFDKESEGARVFPGTENVNASDTFQAISQEAGSSKSMEKPSPQVVEKEENTESLDKFPAPEDASTQKIASQDSEIIPEDYTDALEKLPMPVVVADAPAQKLAVEVATENATEKSDGEILETTPTPDIVTDAPAEKIVSEIVPEEYTDALEKLPATPVVRVADVPIENTNAVENTKQIEEEKSAIENLKQTDEEVKLAVVHDQKPEEKKPVNIEDKKTVEENSVAVEKQIEVVESINATQESDVPVEIK